MPLTVRGKDFIPTRHAADGAHSEGLDEMDLHAILEEQNPAPLGQKQETLVRRGKKTIIVRWMEREHAVYVLNVSATTRRP